MRGGVRNGVGDRSIKFRHVDSSSNVNVTFSRRRCGEVFCADCTSKKALLPTGTAAKASDTKNPRRVCLDCYDALEPMQDALAIKDSNAMRTNIVGELRRVFTGV